MLNNPRFCDFVRVVFAADRHIGDMGKTTDGAGAGGAQGLAGCTRGIAGARLPHLSQREWEVFGLLLDGLSEKQAALRLGLNPHTVHVYVKGLYRALGVDSRGEMFAVVIRWMATVAGVEGAEGARACPPTRHSVAGPTGGPMRTTTSSRRAEPSGAGAERLSPHELRVLGHLLSGDTEGDAACSLGRSVGAFRAEARTLCRRFGVRDREELFGAFTELLVEILRGPK